MSKITISVYLNGTDESNHFSKSSFSTISLPALLNELTVQDASHTTLVYDGCGIKNPYYSDMGGLFTYHLVDQISDAAKKIEKVLAENSKDDVIVNVYGFSRGGVGAFLLCQKLKHISATQLKLNVISFEPVPGNFITTTNSDLFLGTKKTITAAVSDLTDCKNISNMFILFTNTPLPDIIAHAPILPSFPKACNIEVDVTPGCHKGAVTFWNAKGHITAVNTESILVFHRVIDFLEKSGTIFDFNKIDFNDQLKVLMDLRDNHIEKRKFIKQLCDELVGKQKFIGESISRAMHLGSSIFTKPDDRLYLNRYHQSLCDEEKVNDEKSILFLKNGNEVKTEEKSSSFSFSSLNSVIDPVDKAPKALKI